MLYPPGLPRRMQAGSSHHARIKNRGTVNLTFVPLPWPWKWSDTKTLWLTGLALAAFLPSSRTGSRDFAGPPSVPPLPPSVLPLRRSRSDGRRSRSSAPQRWRVHPARHASRIGAKLRGATLCVV